MYVYIYRRARIASTVAQAEKSYPLVVCSQQARAAKQAFQDGSHLALMMAASAIPMRATLCEKVLCFVIFIDL